jgi:hypothetical protein
MGRHAYPSDLPDAEFQYLAPLLPAPSAGRTATDHSQREIVDAVFYY